MDIVYREMAKGDYASVRALWESDPGIGLSAADAEDRVLGFLARNPGTCFVALDGEKTVGSVLCGNDGRRGYLYHLIVESAHRGRGIGSRLVELCIAALKRAGIDKCHLFVFNSNEEAIEFYRDRGWSERDDLAVFSKNTG
jgi:ribosomal protein S18 acetylase RimI-like enzyme